MAATNSPTLFQRQSLPTRRAFLQGTTLWLTAASLAPGDSFAIESQPQIRFAMLTDMHHADKAPAGTRYYRETLPKLREAAAQFAIDNLISLWS